MDLVQFPNPIIISEIRIIPLGAKVEADFPGGVRLGYVEQWILRSQLSAFLEIIYFFNSWGILLVPGLQKYLLKNYLLVGPLQAKSFISSVYVFFGYPARTS